MGVGQAGHARRVSRGITGGWGRVHEHRVTRGVTGGLGNGVMHTGSLCTRGLLERHRDKGCKHAEPLGASQGTGVYASRVFLSRRHREAEARRSLGASHGGKTSTQAGSLFRRHGEARMQEGKGLRGLTEGQGGMHSNVKPTFFKDRLLSFSY